MARSEETSTRFIPTKTRILFYQDVLGMELLCEQNFGDFTLYFLAFDRSGVELTDKEKKETCLAREGVLELTHNHGTESNPDFKGYESGNTDPGRGFGHIAISVEDIKKAKHYSNRKSHGMTAIQYLS